MKKQKLFGLVTALGLMLALTVSAAAFSDVPSGHWAGDAIRRCAQAGWLRGESADVFGLGRPMTRAGFTVALQRFFDWEETALAAPYADVAESDWFAGAVNAAYAQGAVTAQRPDFRPSDPITREEMAVMLVRALGWGPVSGLAQGQSLPFTDVTTNSGYLTLAYDMGLLSGTSATTCAPDAPATREQAAVILMRLHDKLRSTPAAELAIVTNWEDGNVLGDFEAVAISAGRLSVAGKKSVYSAAMKDSAAEVLSAAKAAGAKALLGVTARETVLKAVPADTAALLAEKAIQGGYEGLYLDIAEVSAKNQGKLTALAQAVKAALGDRPFYLAVEAPALTGKAHGGYDYASLAACADRLVVRPAAIEQKNSAIMEAPAAPLEECWYALRHLQALDNVTLLLPARGSAWRGSSEADPLSGAEIEEALAEGAERYYSQRYGCAYLRQNGLTVWYLNEEAARARVQLLGLMGRDRFALSDAQDASGELLAALD